MILGRPYDQDAMLTGDQPMGQLTVPPRRSLSGAIEDALAGGAEYVGAQPYNARELAKMGTFGLGMIPPVGGAMALDEVKKALEERSPVGAAIGAIGLVPGLKSGAQVARRAAGELGSAAETAVADPKLRAKAEALYGKYAHYADGYPEIGPPKLMEKGVEGVSKDRPATGVAPEDAQGLVDAGTHFWSKELTPEVKQFQKDRAIIQKDMEVNGYQKHYDPAQRYDVTGNYGPFADTRVEAAPAKAKTASDWEKVYGSPESLARLQQGYERGQTMPDTDRWYMMGQLENDYMKHLGPEEGAKRFKTDFADMMAATTGGQSPYENFLMSHYVNYTNQLGQQLPTATRDLPFPIGGQYAINNINQARKYLAEGAGAWPSQNPKRYDFSSAFQGNPNAMTIDEQMMTALQPGKQQPQQYGVATGVARDEAMRAGATDPRAYQDVTWGGLKSLKDEARGIKTTRGKPMIDEINDSVETTRRLMGLSPEEVVRRGLVNKEIPMFGAAGALGLGAATQDGEAWQPPEQAQQQLQEQPPVDPRQAIAYSLMQQQQPQDQGM